MSACGRFPPLNLARFSGFERLPLMKAAAQLCEFEKSLPRGGFAPVNCRSGDRIATGGS